MAKQVFRLDFCGRVITVETGEIAKQAGGSVLVRYDDTVVLSTATASNQPKEGIDFFPLTVSFEEKLYSVGKIPGGFLRREGRPSEHATLTARMIDRPIRPLFADGFRNEVQGRQHGAFRRSGLHAGDDGDVGRIPGTVHIGYSLQRTDRRCTGRPHRWRIYHQPKQRTSREK